MKTAAWITLFYGILILIGGIMGHTQAASAISLIMGILFGTLLIIAAAGMFKNRLLPCYSAILLILLLDAFFSYRWLYTFQFFPSGLFSIISIITLIVVIILVRLHLQKERNLKK